ncbi:hypothetical protein QEH59_09935 [Coraliomargarita sp. SDUM461004]|uniref:Uncharacterized protein n=1 Tax=Thalassobacterium sedimentorum TaxID=3041258 RepID=A0ABU1AIX1_9BACT|nr:hypothetical protein [Coraliomargarita sp. SDUM461004]MDQ8194745.1 hypothetical protein [Coraliomargarita sp. SDUM461004]
MSFTLGDKWIASGLFAWSMLWFSVFVIGSLWNLVAPWPVEVWKGFWHVTGVGIPVFMALVTAVWFTRGDYVLFLPCSDASRKKRLTTSTTAPWWGIKTSMKRWSCVRGT